MKPRRSYGAKARTRNDKLADLAMRMVQFPHCYAGKSAEQIADDARLPVEAVRRMLAKRERML